MNQGEIIQEGGPEEIYTAPKTRFVSSFIGEANVFAGNRRAQTVLLDAGARIPSPGADGPVTVVVRPEAMQISREKVAADVELEGTLVDVIYLGVYVKYIVILPSGQRLTVHHPDAALRQSLPLNARVKIGWALAHQRMVEG